MNMALKPILRIFTIICISTRNAKAAFIDVGCKAETVGQYGQHSLLECVIKAENNTKIRVVTWKKEGAKAPLLAFNKGETALQPGCSFAEPSWDVKNMNVSLLITNTAVEHEGVYECMVLTDSGHGNDVTNLKVTAKYNKPTIQSTPKKLTRNTDGTLTCESSGYPKGKIHWFKEHDPEPITSPAMEATQTKSGLFHLSSKLILMQESSVSKYTCVVFNASGGKEEETSFEIQDPPKSEEQGQQKELDPATKIVAPVVVIGSLIAGLLAALLIYRKRSQHARRHSTTPLVGDHQAVRACESDLEEGDHQEMDKTCQTSMT